ncbi:hypothetical protein GKZ28_08610 [Clostridium chromiireducens]|jgi:hypothetical protein|uniref:Uncharacterized protein n=1 Tax=Clostridium chromiireducens TaxID=225345 RepID=A0A964RLI5_9CLOT|nr:hypothetical protein [Clostridium chromiireducens]MVX63755.1 hypothetical protein [Clostridium chromiireducens]
MSKIIAFWSPWHGRGNTSNCIASAMQFSMLNDKESVITHTQYTRSSMEYAFLTGKENDDILKFSDFGLDSLERALATGRLEPKDFNDYCNNIVNKKLEFLPGSKKTNYNLFKESIGQTILDIIDFSKLSKEYTFIDVGTSLKDKVAERVLEKADIIFITLDQSKIVLKDFFEEQITAKVLQNKEVILLIGRYDLDSKYLIKDIKKEFKYDGEIIGIPFITEYSEALNSHGVKKFFEKYYALEDEPFFESLNYINDIILNYDE